MNDPLFTEEDLVFKYTDKDGINDGILMPVSFGEINLVTDGIVFQFGSQESFEPDKFNTFMNEAKRKFTEQRRIKDDWFYSVEIEGKKYFIAENGSNGFTMMLPEEY